MPNYKVKRTFPCRETLVRGQIIEDPNFPNIGQLVRTGYLELVTDEIAPVEKIDEVISDPAKKHEPQIVEPPVVEEIVDETDSTKAVVESPVIEEKVIKEEKSIEPVKEAKSATKAAPKSKAKTSAKK